MAKKNNYFYEELKTGLFGFFGEEKKKVEAIKNAELSIRNTEDAEVTMSALRTLLGKDLGSTAGAKFVSFFSVMAMIFIMPLLIMVVGAIICVILAVMKLFFLIPPVIIGMFFTIVYAMIKGTLRAAPKIDLTINKIFLFGYKRLMSQAIYLDKEAKSIVERIDPFVTESYLLDQTGFCKVKSKIIEVEDHSINALAYVGRYDSDPRMAGAQDEKAMIFETKNIIKSLNVIITPKGIFSSLTNKKDKDGNPYIKMESIFSIKRLKERFDIYVPEGDKESAHYFMNPSLQLKLDEYMDVVKDMTIEVKDGNVMFNVGEKRSFRGIEVDGDAVFKEFKDAKYKSEIEQTADKIKATAEGVVVLREIKLKLDEMDNMDPYWNPMWFPIVESIIKWNDSNFK